MKIIVVFFSFFFFVDGKSQLKENYLNNVNHVYSDTIAQELKLKSYELDSCLLTLFEAIADADKESFYIKNDQIFYSITIEANEKGPIVIDIWPSRWRKVDYFDYFGIMNINGVSFLFRGDYQNHSLFWESCQEVWKVTLKRPNKPSVDEIDKSIDILILNPALRGQYLECYDLKINLLVYIEGKLNGYKVSR